MPNVQLTITVGAQEKVYFVPLDQNGNDLPLAQDVNWDTPYGNPGNITFNAGPIDPTIVTGAAVTPYGNPIVLRGVDAADKRVLYDITVVPVPLVEDGARGYGEPA